MYLHEAVDEEACFTKEEIQQGFVMANVRLFFRPVERELAAGSRSSGQARLDRVRFPGSGAAHLGEALDDPARHDRGEKCRATPYGDAARTPVPGMTARPLRNT